MPPPKAQLSQRDDPSIIAPVALLDGKLLHTVWQSVPEEHRYSFVVWALSEATADALAVYQWR